MLHWNVREQDRVIQEQRSGGVFDEDSGDEASIGSDDEGEVVYEDASVCTSTSGLARQSGLLSNPKAGPRGSRPPFINAHRINRPTATKGPLLRNVVSDELQKALFDISHQLQASSPANHSQRDEEDEPAPSLSQAHGDDGNRSPSPRAQQQSTPPTQSGSPFQQKCALNEEASGTEPSKFNGFSSQKKPEPIQSQADNTSDDDIADFHVDSEPFRPSQSRPPNSSQSAPRPDLASQRTVRGAKSWFGSSVVRSKPLQKLAGSKRAAAQTPNLKSPAKSQRKTFKARMGPPEMKTEAAPPQSWGRLREKQARERRGKPAAEDDITDFSDDAAANTAASLSSQHAASQPLSQQVSAAAKGHALSPPRNDAALSQFSQQSVSGRAAPLQDAGGGGVACVSRGQQFLKHLRGASVTAAAKQDPPSRAKSKRKGELSKRLERVLQLQERESVQLKQSLQTAEGLLDKLQASQGSGLTVVLVSEHFEAHLYVSVAIIMGGDNRTSRERVCILWPGGTRKSLGLAVGSVVHLFQPWGLHCYGSDGVCIMLGSERCVVLPAALVGGLYPAKDLCKVGGIELVVPHHLREEKERIASLQATPPFVWQLPHTVVCRAQQANSVSKLTKIAALAPWQANISVRGMVLRSCPRSVLIANGCLDDGGLRERLGWMEVVASSAEFQRSAACEPCVWFADDSGMACRIYTQPQATEQWRELFLGFDGQALELNGLSLRRTDEANLAGHDSADPEHAEWKRMPVSKYELVITTRSRRLEQDSSPVANVQPDAVRYQPVTLASLFRLRTQFERKRVTVLVELVRIHALPSDGKDGTPYQTWMCVCDPSLHECNCRNVLVIVADLNQVLASADVLTPGDFLLIKDVVVTTNSAAGADAEQWGGVTLSVDALSLITCAVADGKGSSLGVNGACGMVLPVTEVDPKRLDDIRSDRRADVALRDCAEAPFDGWVTVRGQVVEVSEVSARSLCAVCRGERLTTLDDEDDEYAEDSHVLICDECEEVMESPLVAFGPCRVLLRTAQAETEVWLRGSLVAKLLGPARDDGSDWEEKLRLLAVGRIMRAECVRVVSDDAGAAGSTCWAASLSLG